MPGIKPGETLSQYAIRVAFETGNFWNPESPEGFNVSYNDLKNLKPTDDVVVRAMISMSKMDAARYTKHVLEKHSRPPVFDGLLGPALEAMVQEGGRCPVPDYAPPVGVSFQFEDPYVQEVALRMQSNATLPALGVGNWKSCHNVGDFHSAIIRVNPAGMPSFLAPVFKTVLQRTQRAYAGIGLLFRFTDQAGKDLLNGEVLNGTANSEMSFVASSSGWIGLAIVGQNETCSSSIWCRFLATYKGGQTEQDVVTQWTSLIKHELGHNCGRGHTSGGVMNPSIVNGLPELWASDDPSTGWLKSQFGGVPVPIPGGTPVPPPPPNPPSDLQKQIDALQIGHTVQQVVIDWLVRKVKDLP